jgi:hypothetical protein
MRSHRPSAWAAATLVLVGFWLAATEIQPKAIQRARDTVVRDLPSVVIRDAAPIQLPGVEVPARGLLHECDSNSPAHWDGDTLYVFNSYSHPWRSSGPDLFHLDSHLSTRLGDLNDKLDLWIEATWKDDRDGTLYGAFHYEPDAVCFSNKHLPTMPRIGWLRSQDNGAVWEDLGFIIEANRRAVRCDTESPWDCGGTGDFSFVLDQNRDYFYFFGTSYDSEFAEQGVWVARMRFSDRANPSGKVMKWHQGAWSEPGLWGHVTPVFPAERDYHGKDGSMFWGPSVHWNTYLGMYVMLLNHAIDTRLTADGIFISFNMRLDDPARWSKPRMILDRAEIQRTMTGAGVSATKSENGWYPEVIGTEKGETDKIVGRSGRFFMAGWSRKEITFLKPGERVE